MSTTNSVISEDQIRAIAYALWLEEGRPDGRAEHHWHKASELVAKEFTIPALEIGKPKRKPAAKKTKSA